jgi:hypothetical protein
MPKETVPKHAASESEPALLPYVSVIAAITALNPIAPSADLSACVADLAVVGAWDKADAGTNSISIR